MKDEERTANREGRTATCEPPTGNATAQAEFEPRACSKLASDVPLQRVVSKVPSSQFDVFSSTFR